MQIKYLKDTPLGAVGEIHDVPETEARVLIILGIAEALADKSTTDKPKRKPKTENELELS